MNPLVIELQLVAYFSNGNRASFEALYHQYHKTVYANILKYVHDQEVAKDILQEVFVSLWENRSIFNTGSSVAGWLFIVSHNKSLNYLKKEIAERKAIEHFTNYNSGDIITDEKTFELQEAVLNEAIEMLTPSKREIYTLCKLKGKSYNEAAILLNTTPAVVKEHLKAASKSVRKYASMKLPRITYFFF